MANVEHSAVSSLFPSFTFTVEQTVLAIRALSNNENGGPVDTSHFHLSRCVCGVPMWQQPCAICHYYPMGADPDYTKRIKDHYSKMAVRELFRRAIERAGNIAVWYVSGWRKTAAWSDGVFGREPTAAHMAFRAAIEALEDKARQIPCASAEDIFDVVIGQGINMPRFHKGDLNALDALDGYPDIWVGDTITRSEAGKIRRLQDEGLVSMDEYLKVTDAGKRVLSDYALEFLDQ